MNTNSASRSSQHRSQSLSFSRRRVIWARRPFASRFGKLIGIAVESGRVSVAIYSPFGPRWVPAHHVLAPAEAEVWASYGFDRR